MKPLPFLLVLAVITLSTPLRAADAATEVKDAIKKLADQPNYSWTLTPRTEGSEAGTRQGPVEGKTMKDGLTFLKGTANEISFQAAVKGGKIAVNYADEWVVVDENDELTGRVAKRLKGVKDPLGMASELAGKTKSFKKEDGAYAGELDPTAARELFRTLGRRAAEAEEAKGSTRFWVKDGQLSKYEFTVKGTITVGGDKKEVNLSRTVTVDFKDIGSTKVTLPDEVLKKFE